MNIPAIKKYCASLPHAKAEIKWGIDHVFTIGAKMFAVVFADEAGNAHVSFKVDDDLFLQYADRPGFIPAPYLARAKWVQVKDLKAVSDTEMKALLKRSYELVSAKLTRQLKTELGLVPKK
jgi:predicted DNA-binding protein (MmcQ/YjbR family)